MKILHIINSLGTGGAEKLLVDTLPLYLKKGITAELLLLNGTRTPFYDQLEKTPRLPIYHLGYGSLFNPLLTFRIIPFLNKYDLIHVHLFPAFYWTALAKVFSGSKTKLVYTKHSTSNRRIDFSWFTKRIEKWMLKRYARIITISPEVDSILKKLLRFPPGTFSLIENGIDLAKIEGAHPLAESFFKTRDKDEKIVIQVSSFRVPKDQPTLVKAMALLPGNIKLLLVGDGPQKAECEKLTEELDLQGRTEFLGTRTDIPQLLKAADVVVLSTAFEGFGLAAVEGMAAAKPVVASDVPGVKGIVKDAGLLFPKGDAITLAKQITDLMSDPDYYHRIALACLERSKNYDLNAMVQKHINLYMEVIKP
ncbi:MAG: glycosyltransferase [Chitinophagaceae bacterium]|nr:MAG: glycosyltransferase [Chitinophagaceae bacterium]